MPKKPLSRSRPRKAAPVRQPIAERGWTRRPLHRIYEIHTWVKAGRYPNCQQLAGELEMTAKTVQRDINFMRDESSLPLASRPRGPESTGWAACGRRSMLASRRAGDSASSGGTPT